MNDSAPTQTTSEDDETTSVAERLKNLYEKHKKKIFIGGTVIAVTTGVLIGLAQEQVVTTDAQDAEDTEAPRDIELAPGPVAVDQKRQPAVRHHVGPSKRRLADGRIIDVSPYERGVVRA